jgi:hypothetical protein
MILRPYDTAVCAQLTAAYEAHALAMLRDRWRDQRATARARARALRLWRESNGVSLAEHRQMFHDHGMCFPTPEGVFK